MTYRDLGDGGAETITEWVEQAAAHYRADPHVRHVEWKTRGHDRAPGLHEALHLPRLTEERARSALGLGKQLMNSDSTEFSRPILERAGFVKVSTTTPYTRTLP